MSRCRSGFESTLFDERPGGICRWRIVVASEPGRTLFSTWCGVSIAAPRRPPVVKCKGMSLAVGHPLSREFGRMGFFGGAREFEIEGIEGDQP